MSLEKLLLDYRIPYQQPPHRNVRRGWIGIHCPYCPGSRDFHCGAPATGTSVFVCWRCGTHSVIETIATVLNVPRAEAYRLAKDYGIRDNLPTSKDADSVVGPQRRVAVPCDLPTAVRPLQGVYKKYLKSRGLDPITVAGLWNLGGGGVAGPIAWRILAPITMDGVPISWQARAVTPSAKLRWLSCPAEKETAPGAKGIVYGMDLAVGPNVLVVEGPGDAWKVGPGAVATFGTKWTPAQATLLAERWEQVYIAYDTEDENAYRQAKALAVEVGVQGTPAEVLELDAPDPGELTTEQVADLVNELQLGGF